MSAGGDGGAAFPCEGGPDSGIHPDPGMSLRDYFAGKAMAALIAKLPLLDQLEKLGQGISEEEIVRLRYDVAESAYCYADAMIAARSSESGRREG